MSNSQRHQEKRRQRARMKQRPGTSMGLLPIHCRCHRAISKEVPSGGLMGIVRRALGRRKGQPVGTGPPHMSRKERRGLQPRKAGV